MNVIEREQVQVGVDSVREGRARVLEAAALEIEVRGWCQVDEENEAGNLCLIGAVVRALGNDPASFWELGRVWSGCEPTIDHIRPLWLFNDERGRTAAEVTFVLRWRAAEIRDGR